MNRSFKSTLKTKNLTYLSRGNPQPTGGVAQRVALVLHDGFSLMAFSAAMDALWTANHIANTLIFELQVAGEGERVASDVGIHIPVTQPLGTLQMSALDCVLVCEPEGVHLTRHRGRRRNSRACTAGVADLMLGLLAVSCEPLLLKAVQEMLLWRRGGEREQASTLTPVIDRVLPTCLQAALELMRTHVEAPLGMETIARRVGQSRRQLERDFRRHVEASPTRYYLELRLTHARQLLLHTEKSLTEVSLASGFVSTAHFYRRFRELFALAPKEFRLRARRAANSLNPA
ncbi:helix-turn-helix domain-containing protein [Pseudomonas fakonensis]|uniref:Helix-turn-helix domain-containing protein n=1 Tax=Pseudomonas fakonensis TaxID=2842355 RepID=A0ABX8N1S8_9PSED|nr:helix-turn-helix domain-containing protein [Pseudomonas fakonensis]QXH49892.1 helix-turn-helix domain-containing protein [Pseudomonas fakonensis]